MRRKDCVQVLLLQRAIKDGGLLETWNQVSFLSVALLPGIQKVISVCCNEPIHDSKYRTRFEFYSPFCWLLTAFGFLPSARQPMWIPPSLSLLRAPDRLACVWPLPSSSYCVCSEDGCVSFSGLFPWQLVPSLWHTQPACSHQALPSLPYSVPSRVCILSRYRMSFIKRT